MHSLVYHSATYTGVQLSDLEGLSRLQLLALNADVNTQLISLKQQIQSAIDKYKTTGVPADGDWFRRVRARRALVAGFYSHLSVALAKSKAQGKRDDNSGHEVRRSVERLPEHLPDVQHQALPRVTTTEHRGIQRMGRSLQAAQRARGR